jgi:hypothetical protein
VIVLAERAKLLGEKRESSAGAGIDESDAAQRGRVHPPPGLRQQADCLIAAQSLPLVDAARVDCAGSEIASRPRDEERAGLRESVQTCEVDVSAIHHVERTRLEDELVHRRDIAAFSSGNTQEHGEVATQVQERVELDRAAFAFELRPREEAQAQPDRRGVQCVHAPLQSHRHGLIDVERPGLFDQHLCQIGPDAPVTPLVGVGERGARDVPADAQVIQRRARGAERADGVAQAVAKGHLREGHAQQLVMAREASYPPIAMVPGNASRQV